MKENIPQQLLIYDEHGNKLNEVKLNHKSIKDSYQILERGTYWFKYLMNHSVLIRKIIKR